MLLSVCFVCNSGKEVVVACSAYKSASHFLSSWLVYIFCNYCFYICFKFPCLLEVRDNSFENQCMGIKIICVKGNSNSLDEILTLFVFLLHGQRPCNDLVQPSV